MIKPIFISLLMTLPLISLAESKKTIHVETAGSLSTLISADEKYTITDLTVSGSLNSTDLLFIREMVGSDIVCSPTAGKVTKLDMSDARIIFGYENYIEDGFADSRGNYGNPGVEVRFASRNDVLGSCLFAGCDKLEEVKLPQSITEIGDYVFYFGWSLKSLTIPKNVKSIGKALFPFCESLVSLDVDKENTTFRSPEGSNAIIKDKTLVLGCGNTDLTNCDINTIGSYAFFTVYPSNGHLKLPVGVTTIKDYAFNCSQYHDVDLPEGLQTIESQAFSYSELKSVKLPSTLTSIGDGAFTDCKLSKVTSYAKDPSVIHLGEKVFTSYGTLYVPKGCKAAYEAVSPFKYFTIKEIDIEKSITVNVETPGTLSSLISEDGKYVIEELTVSGNLNGTDLGLIREMAGCDVQGKLTIGSLRKLDMSEARIVAGGENYLDASEVYTSYRTGTTFGGQVRCSSEDDKLGDYLFIGCEKLEEVTLPKNITAIGVQAFSLVPCIKKVTSYIQDPSQVTMGRDVFDGISADAILYVPKGRKTAYEAAAGWRGFAEIREQDGSGETSIHSIAIDASESPIFYNIQGQQITHPSKGLYIRNGKKVIVR